MKLFNNVNSYQQLPDEYEESFQIDLAKDKKLFYLVNGACILIALVLFLLGSLYIPITSLLEGSFWFVELRLLGTGFGMIGYLVLHEAVHGIFIRLFSGKKADYGFSLAYAYAGSKAYFTKLPYLVIALAPIVVWGLIFAVFCVLVSKEVFWVFYALQIANISGAAGDLYVFWRFSKLPADILVQDVGVSMTVYTRKGEQ